MNGKLFRPVFLLLTLLLLCHAIPAQSAQRRFYIAPDDHTDYMWTANEEQYRQAFIEMLDYYLAQIDQSASQPADYHARWNCDGSFWLWEYERNKSAAEFNRLIERIRDGHVSAPLNALVSCYGGAPAEAVLRGMYYPGSLERRYGLRFTMAAAIENQTMPLGLGALWAGAGAKYSWKGICACATKTGGFTDREHEVYWWRGLDGSNVLTKWYSMQSFNENLGGYAEARTPAAAIDLAEVRLTDSPKYPYNVYGIFGKGWDDFKTFTDEFPRVARETSVGNRRVICSNEEDFFQDFEASHGPSLPSLSVTYGNEWDLYCASMAEVSARIKRSVEKLRNAEAMATLVSLQNSGFMNGRQTQRDQAWMNLGLYWEHDWTADGPVGREARAAWQRRITGEVESYVDTLHSDAATTLGGLIRKSGGNERFYVFNSLSWTRTDVADLPYTNTSTVHVVDVTTGQQVPSQIVTLDGQRYLRVLAQNIPAVGYRVFEVRSGAGTSFSNAASASGSVIENNLYRITMAGRGAVTSLIDKTRGNREFVREINGRAINDLGSGTGTLEIENAGPVSVTLKATSSDPLAHTSRLTLIRDKDRIEIRNQITQNFGDVRTWGFGVNLDNPSVHTEEVGAVISTRLRAAGGHYAERNARYDWLTLNHFADIGAGSGVGITLSNADCYFAKLGNSTPQSLDTTTPLLSPLVGGQIDDGLGIFNQGGDTNFLQRFALQTRSSYDQVSAMKFALEHQNPLVAALVTGNSTSAYPENTYSLVTISNPNVLLWALKPAEEGIAEGVIARTWNLSDSQAAYTLQTASPIRSAFQISHIETNIGSASVGSSGLSANAAPQQMQSFRLNVSESAARTTTTVSAADYNTSPLARESIVAAFGTGLATGTGSASSTPLPTSLAGTTVSVRDSADTTRNAQLFFVSPTQVNYLVPRETALGAATVTIRSSDGTVSSENIQIAQIKPSLFSADASGNGLAAANALRVTNGGVQTYEAIAQFDASQGRYVAIPIDLGGVSDQVFLVLYGTGLRFRSSLSAVSVTIGGEVAAVTYAGDQGGLIGLDQINARIPRSLIGRGDVNVVVLVDGQAANALRVAIR
jgi:alpha-mannosidase